MTLAERREGRYRLVASALERPVWMPPLLLLVLDLPRVGLLALLHLFAETAVQCALLFALFAHGGLLDLQQVLFGDALLGHAGTKVGSECEGTSLLERSVAFVS